MKTVFFIGGFKLNRTAADSQFAQLRQMLAALGYRVVPVPITWNRRTVTSYAKHLKHFYMQNRGEYNIIMGNSFGAMAALVAAPALKPDELILCSLSAFFAEDLHQYDKSDVIAKFGRLRTRDLHQISADQLAQAVNRTGIRVTMTYGELEKDRHPKLVSRVRQTAAAIEDTRLIELPGAGHRMREPRYVAGLKAFFSKTSTPGRQPGMDA